MCNSKHKNVHNINVDLEDVILTPLTCACLVNEILKCLVYQKSLIPYPYNWLKNVIKKKRDCVVSGTRKTNLIVQRHFHVASSAFDAVEEIMRNVLSEFVGREAESHEVMIVFGSTVLTAKEVYTIRIPMVAKGHVESNHESSIHRSQHKVLKNIFLSQEWLASMDDPHPSTNMYVMINKSTPLLTEDFFVEQPDFAINPNTKNTIINLNYDGSGDTCCRNLAVFEDDGLQGPDRGTGDGRRNVAWEPRSESWYQARVLLKGFKDCYIDKVSASELW